jgi:alpha-L-rhamnosidase
MAIQRIILTEQPFNSSRPDHWTQRGLWPAKWISLPAEPPFVSAYKLAFDLAAPCTFRFHVTADERYELFLDGEFIGRGPERGDTENWFFESYDANLDAGSHVLVARVWTLGKKAPFAQMSVRSGFLLGVEGENAPQLDTGIAPWTAKLLGGYDWQGPTSAWGTGWNEIIHGAEYDWNHEIGEGDGWNEPQVGVAGARYGSQQETIHHHRLRPASLPSMLDRWCSVGTVRHVANWEARPVGATPVRHSDSLNDEFVNWQNLLTSGQAFEIPANTKRRVLIDLEEYYCARPELNVSGGKDSRLDVIWTEALYCETETWSKDNRDEIEGKFFTSLRSNEDGPGDTFFLDGGSNRIYRPLWWQAGRYVQILVETTTEPLTINSLGWRETRYPLENEGFFAASDEQLATLIPPMVRGLQMCAHETYMDCPFYEQMMYVGDTRLEVLVTYLLTKDDALPKKALQLFDWSRLQSGLTQSRYPCWARQIIPPFSMWWVAMVHDYALWRGEPSFTKSLLPGVRAVCDHFASLIDDNGLMNAPDGWNFTDWVKTTQEQLKYYGGDPKWRNGVPPTGSWEVSGILNWQAALIFRLAGEIESWFGEPELATLQNRRATRLANAADKHFWNETRELYADDLAHEHWSEHAQCMAILSGFVAPEKISRLEAGLLNDADLARATIYFSHYLFETFRQLGRPEAFLERLDLWKGLVKNDLKTTIEMPEPTRSDCHAWGAHPLYHFYSTLAGIRPVAPSFSEVEIKPQLGTLTSLEARIPHPKGEIIVRVKDGAEEVELPTGVTRSS